MRVMVTGVAPDLDAEVDHRFGRGAYFVVVDSETLEWQAHRNEAADSAGGAGSQAAQFVSRQGVEAVISGHFGPNAFLALRAGGIRMVRLGASPTVREAVIALAGGDLDEVSGPSGAGRHKGR
jgi:predicted Fe-Mo cluster-binding NifX family protein